MKMQDYKSCDHASDDARSSSDHIFCLAFSIETLCIITVCAHIPHWLVMLIYIHVGMVCCSHEQSIFVYLVVVSYQTRIGCPNGTYTSNTHRNKTIATSLMLIGWLFARYFKKFMIHVILVLRSRMILFDLLKSWHNQLFPVHAASLVYHRYIVPSNFVLRWCPAPWQLRCLTKVAGNQGNSMLEISTGFDQSENKLLSIFPRFVAVSICSIRSASRTWPPSLGRD